MSDNFNNSCEDRLHIVLYQPEIPYNTGNVGRTCVAVGAKLWLVRPLGFRVDDKHLRRAGMDYWQHLDWQAVDGWADLLDHLPQERMWYFSKFATRSYTEIETTPGDVLVFGSESSGLPSAWREEKADRFLKIPIHPNARSLNLSNAVAVAAFEAKRQWNLSHGQEEEKDSIASKI
ncbi:MAG: tRNA (cytidine(34)-2'-O)-methyltransferase [Pirellulales bacterium]|nr:tRNA (cytidine(34)-2'-O)-methyltransferase [Pirellulales bacterium]